MPALCLFHRRVAEDFNHVHAITCGLRRSSLLSEVRGFWGCTVASLKYLHRDYLKGLKYIRYGYMNPSRVVLCDEVVHLKS